MVNRLGETFGRLANSARESAGGRHRSADSISGIFFEALSFFASDMNLSGILQKLVLLGMGVVLLALGVMFSLALLPFAIAAGLGLWGWLWWKTRSLRRAMQEGAAGERIIEGEATVIEVAPESLPRSSAER